MDSIRQRVEHYARNKNRVIYFDNRLGHGQDGEVWPTESKTAVKGFARFQNYNMELQCYLRFRAKNVQRIGKLRIPQLVDFDDELLIVEMDIVTPPYLLDFGKVYLDQAPPYFDTPEIVEEYETQLRERWGDNYPAVAALLWALESQFGIHYVDAKPGNISFGDEFDVQGSDL